jgi:MEMO1 family protein
MSPAAIIRASTVAGLFYSKIPDVLRKELADMFSAVDKKPVNGRIMGIVAPHAGYMYSGPTAAAAYAQIKGEKYDTVVIVSPSHHEFFEGVSVFPGDMYETPLGKVRIDTALRTEALAAGRVLRPTETGHRQEHAIEVQLPFLQYALGEFLLLPLVVGHQTRDTCFSLAETLAEVLAGKNALLVASTDLSHYYPSAVARRLDQVASEDIVKFDPATLMDHLDGGVAEACGGGPAVSVMMALQRLGATHMEVVAQCNSGDITGESDSVVGYLSAIAWSSRVRPT